MIAPRRAAATVAILLAVLAGTMNPLAASPQTGSPGRICEVDSTDAAPLAWIRQQRVAARVAERCQSEDVADLFPFDRATHAADVVLLAPMICRFDRQILLLDHGAGGRRLVCVFSGTVREVR
jgi:hypothetical protein